MKSKSQTAPSATDDVKPDVRGVNGHATDTKVKVEEKMDESQLTRLATGVTIDAGTSGTTAPPPRTEKAAFIELRKGIIQVTAVENDGTPRSLIILTGLKTLFRTQLPMMPREYIARLVYDSNSKALAIIKRGYKVVGGICYRPFPHRDFAEIVFFATASVDQVKGYGGMLMDHFKAHIRKTYPNIMHFLTYADNFAVIFFKKQGFSKEITLDRSVWAGYIKDYEGGTIMQCTMLRKVDYLDKVNIITQQREAVIAKIREKSRSHVVYPGLPQFQEGTAEGITVDPKDIPGLRESGWTPGMISCRSSTPRSAEQNFMHRLLGDLKSHASAWAFLHPVNGEEVVDYYDVIKRPMDLSMMEHKLNTNQYPNFKAFIDDTQLIFDNCRLYNPEGSVYVKHAMKLEKFMKEQVNDYARRLA
ncbi:Bromodomain-containing protein [Scleroderma citrinum]